MATLAAMLIGAFISVFILVFSKALTPKPSLQQRIEQLYGKSQITSIMEDQTESRKGIMEVVRQKLEGTGIQMKIEELFMMSVLSGFFSLVIFWSVTGDFLFSLVIGLVVVGVVPYYLVETRRKARLQKIDEQLAEALTLMSSGLRAGESVPQAFQTMEQQMDPPISEEWARINGELRLGEPLDKVLTNFRNRIPSQDVDMFVSAVLIARQSGGDLAEVLDNISATIQDRISLKREVIAKTSMARISSLVLSLAPGLMFVVLYVVNPDYINGVLEHPMGAPLLVVALVLNVLGARISSRMVKMDDLEVVRKK